MINIYANKKLGSDKELATLNDINAINVFDSVGTNYVTFKNGLKMCWGRATTYNLNGYFRQADIGFPISFTQTPNITTSFVMSDGAVADARTSCGVIGTPNTSSVIIRVGNPSAELTSRNIQVDWFAIGF